MANQNIAVMNVTIMTFKKYTYNSNEWNKHGQPKYTYNKCHLKAHMNQ